MTVDPVVDAVIAVHDASRPVGRAVRSLTQSGLSVGDDLRITIVCHNISASAINSALPEALAARVRFLELADGIPSAAGPFTAGLEQATGRFVSIMGSDDYLEPGALARWLDASDRETDAVIPPQKHADGSVIRTPPIRPFRRGDLDPVKDRLSYRTAPLGLIRRSAIDRLGLRFPAGLRTGEDQNFSSKLWFGGGVLRYAAGAPRYIVGADANTRVSTTSRPLETEFAFIDQLLGDPWFASLPVRSRRSIAIKLIRIHVFAGMLARIEAGVIDSADHSYVVGLIKRMRAAAPAFERPFSLADRRALDAIANPEVKPDEIARLTKARRRFGHPSTLVTRDIRGLIDVEGPLRFMVASALV
jgi:hypothetical protein